MALTDFTRINLPYGIERNEKGEWTAFNREYLQSLGYYTAKDSRDKLASQYAKAFKYQID